MTASNLRDQLQAALGPAYRVGQELGGGGMSRVFVVEELDLDRKLVAKLLPPEVCAGVSAERFRREIQLAARLQHPHIVPLLAAGAREGLLYYTMPFIEGESLRARITREQQLPVHDVVRVLREVADALSYAHAHGVVHRDIKPDNVLLSSHHALVADFGVSKAISTSTSGGTLTSVGVALGTPSYMSPEQISADPATDHRADIYALGALGYELLTGRPPFTAATAQQVLAAHLSQTPEPIRQQRASVPPELERIILKCLEKVPADRWSSADELLAQLEALATPGLGLPPTQATQATQPITTGRRTNRWWFVAGAGLTAGAIGLLAMKLNAGTPFETGGTRKVTNTPGLELHPAVSPDGKLVAYASGNIGSMRIYWRPVGGERATLVSEGMPGDHRWPAWSADGTQISFYTGTEFAVVAAFGGQPRPVSQAAVAKTSIARDQTGSIAALSPDMKQVAYVNDDGNLVVHALAGGDARVIVSAKDIHSITWSHDGARLAYVTDNADYVYSQYSLGNIAPSVVWVARVDGGAPVQVSDNTHLNTSPTFTPDADLLYVSNASGGRDIYYQRLASSGKPRGSAARLTTGLNVHTISLSADGTKLVYSDLARRANLHIAPVLPNGPTPVSAVRAVTNENQVVEGGALSHDGRWIVYDSNRGGRQQLYKIPVTGGEPVQLTNDSTDHFAPRWTRDDRHIVFHDWHDGNRNLAMIDANGVGEQRLTSAPVHEYYPDLSPDGMKLLLRYQTGSVSAVAMMTRGPNGWSEPKVLVDTSAYSRWSPDGRYFAAGRGPTIVIGTAEGRIERVLRLDEGPVQTNARGQVNWSRDGRTIFYSSFGEGGTVSYWSIPAAGGRPRLVLEYPADMNTRPRRPEFDSDGRQLVFSVMQDDADVWMMELRRR